MKHISISLMVAVIGSFLLVTSGCGSDSYTLARSILGDDLITPEEIMRSRDGVSYTRQQRSQFRETIPPKEVLEWGRDNGYMLVAGPGRPMSLLEIRELNRDYFYAQGRAWYEEFAFSQEKKVGPEWIMLRKEPAPRTFSKHWNDQLGTLTQNEAPATAVEVVWGLTTYKAVRDVYLLSSRIFTRTDDMVLSRRVNLGHFDEDGLRLNNDRDGTRDGLFGLSPVRKL